MADQVALQGGPAGTLKLCRRNSHGIDFYISFFIMYSLSLCIPLPAVAALGLDNRCHHWASGGYYEALLFRFHALFLPLVDMSAAVLREATSAEQGSAAWVPWRSSVGGCSLSCSASSGVRVRRSSAGAWFSLGTPPCLGVVGVPARRREFCIMSFVRSLVEYSPDCFFKALSSRKAYVLGLA